MAGTDGPRRTCGQCGYEPMTANAAKGGGWVLDCPSCCYEVFVSGLVLPEDGAT